MGGIEAKEHVHIHTVCAGQLLQVGRGEGGGEEREGAHGKCGREVTKQWDKGM